MREITKNLSKWALPWVATFLTRMPYTRKRSLILDRFLILAEESYETDFQSGREYPRYPEILGHLKRREVVKANRDYRWFRVFESEDVSQFKKEVGELTKHKGEENEKNDR